MDLYGRAYIRGFMYNCFIALGYQLTLWTFLHFKTIFVTTLRIQIWYNWRQRKTLISIFCEKLNKQQMWQQMNTIRTVLKESFHFYHFIHKNGSAISNQIYWLNLVPWNRRIPGHKKLFFLCSSVPFQLNLFLFHYKYYWQNFGIFE